MPVYEVGVVGPICFIASAFVDGPSLAEWLCRAIGTSLREQGGGTSRPVGRRDAIRALARCGASGPQAEQCVAGRSRQRDGSAVLPARVTKITDFGLAKLLDLSGDDTRSGAVVGTPAYMSPEQATADHAKIGPSADIYSLGAILYELLTRRPPFRGNSDTATLNKLTTEEPAAPRRQNLDVPRDLEAITLRCLEKQPQRRYATAGALAEDLRRFLAGEPTEARPLSPAGRLIRWAARNRRVAALLATVMGLLVGISMISTVAAIRINRERDATSRVAEMERESRRKADLALVAEQESLKRARAPNEPARKPAPRPKPRRARLRQSPTFWSICF